MEFRMIPKSEIQVVRTVQEGWQFRDHDDFSSGPVEPRVILSI